MKLKGKHLVILGAIFIFGACGRRCDTLDTQEEAEKINVQTKVKNETVMVPDKIYFAFDSAKLNNSSKETLNTVAEWLKSKSDIKIIIEGHCDERGTREYNLALGQKRAESAKNYLVSKNIDANRIKVVSYGKEKPELLGSGESVWSKNRRAVVVELK